jgi:hypothetical protein
MKNLLRFLVLIILFSNNYIFNTAVTITKVMPSSGSLPNDCVECNIPGVILPGQGIKNLVVSGTKTADVASVSVIVAPSLTTPKEIKVPVKILSSTTWTTEDSEHPTSVPTAEGSNVVIRAFGFNATAQKIATAAPMNFISGKFNSKLSCGNCGTGVLCKIPQDILTITILNKYNH